MAPILPAEIVSEKQFQSTVDAFLSEFQIGKLLRRSNFQKAKGVPCLSVFRTLFLLVFTGKNLYRTLQTGGLQLPFAKDCVYRFLNSCRFNWRKFLMLLAQAVTRRLSALTSDDRVSVFVIDDSMFSRNRSRAVELLSRFMDHAENRFIKGYRMLTLGWSDGNSFVPLSFSLLTAKEEEKRLCGIDPTIDKRTIGYARRREAMQKSTAVLMDLLAQAKAYGITAKHVLFDSWFAFPSLIVAIKETLELDTICMLKDLPANRYSYQGKRVQLGELYGMLEKKDKKRGIIASAIVELKPKEKGNPILARVLFFREPDYKRDWRAFLSTDLELPDEEILRIYGKRWDIEVFFKATKSLLRLAKEFQGRSYDSMVAHTSIVFVRYIMLSWTARLEKDGRALGELFYHCCDEVRDITLAESLHRIWSKFKESLQQLMTASDTIINTLLGQFVDCLPSHIRARMPYCTCES